VFELDENFNNYSPYSTRNYYNHEDFKAALRISPVTISFATTEVFFQYESGIYDVPDCPT